MTVASITVEKTVFATVTSTTVVQLLSVTFICCLLSKRGLNIPAIAIATTPRSKSNNKIGTSIRTIWKYGKYKSIAVKTSAGYGY